MVRSTAHRVRVCVYLCVCGVCLSLRPPCECECVSVCACVVWVAMTVVMCRWHLPAGCQYRSVVTLRKWNGDHARRDLSPAKAHPEAVISNSHHQTTPPHFVPVYGSPFRYSVPPPSPSFVLPLFLGSAYSQYCCYHLLLLRTPCYGAEYILARLSAILNGKFYLSTTTAAPFKGVLWPEARPYS